MRILALDHGTVRIGVAISDELQMIASPLEFIPAEPAAAAFARIAALVAERQVGLVVVGMPRNMDGTRGPAAHKVEEFMTALREQVPVPLKAWDERLTSVQANRLLIEGRVRRKERREKVDKMAAAILLQSYLDGAAVL